MEKIYTSEFIVILIHNEFPKLVISKLEGFLKNNNELKKSLSFILAFLHKEKCEEIIFDFTHLQAIADEVLELFHTWFFPTLKQISLKNLYFIDANEIFGKVSVDFLFDPKALKENKIDDIIFKKITDLDTFLNSK